MSSRIESGEVLANSNNINVFKRERPIGPENIPQDTSYERYSSIIPGSEFGEVSLTSGFLPFISGYRAALEKGELTSFIAENVGIDYSSIYKIKGNETTLMTEVDYRIARQHSAVFLDAVDSNLSVLLDNVRQSSQPAVYADEYIKAIDAQLRFTKCVRQAVTPEFTALQKSSQEWADLIDVVRSLEKGGIILKYEDVARETLETAYKRRQEKGVENYPVKKALEFWKLNEKEAEYVGIAEIEGSDLELDPEKGARLIEVLLKRMGAYDWSVERDESAAVQVVPRDKKVRFPKNRRPRGKDTIWIPAHELFHVVRAINGAKQGLKLLGTEDIYNYLATEEGSGAVAEMVAGQEFGDERQAKMAARYFAVSQMLKADRKNGQIFARYSPQEVYDQLKSYGVSHVDASDIIWRIQRGTTLKHNGVSIPIKTKDGTGELPAAECFVKDAVYFEGQMQVFEWMKSLMPIFEGARRSETLESPDFSDNLLKHVGYALQIEGAGRKLSLTELRQVYNELIVLGRDQLFEILNILGRGKMRLDFLTTEREKWEGLIANTGLTDYRTIFSPAI